MTAAKTKDKYGKWSAAGWGSINRCRYHVSLKVSKKKIRGQGDSHCKRKAAQVVVTAITINNDKAKYDVTRRNAKNIFAPSLKMKNPRGTQKICALGYVNHPLDETNPKRSEAKVCIKG
ncbi:hypothetical protein ACWGH2_10430 [Streptomyces sp. NPDC054871]